MEYLQRHGLAGVANFHLDSFNFATEDGLKCVVKNIPAVQVKDYSGNIIEISYEKADVGIRDEDRDATVFPIYPAEARVQKITYSTNLNLAFCWKKNGRKLHSTFRKIVIPNMVKSKKCILSRRCDMQKLKEDEKDPGGYFIINGMEYVIPLTLVQRRNHPLAIKQPFWKKRGKLFSEYGVSVHSVKEDQSSVDLVLHFVVDGSMIIVLRLHSRLIFIPLLVVLKALVNECDYFIYCNLLKGNEDDYTLSRYIKNMLRDLHEQNIFSDDCAKSYIGKSINYFSGLPKWFSTRDVGEHILKEMILVHLEKYTDKFNFLCYMVKKLWNLVQNKCLQDNMDNITNLEVLTSGHLYLLALKENMIQFLMSSKRILEKKIETEKSDFKLTEDVMKKCMMRAFSFSTDMKSMISTGNVPATKLGLKQSTGFSLLIQRLNIFRFISYFRRLQQGSNVSSFGNLCMRKMLPECWGFLCPIHTPSSEQIGLVNHATMNCEIVTSQLLVDDLPKLLVELGMYPNFSPLPFPPSNAYHVFLDGKIMGLLAHNEASDFLSSLKNLKVSQDKRVSPFLEIVLVPMTEEFSLSPGIYIFSTPGRMMRPVMNIKANAIEHIGVLEQAFLGIDLCVKQAAANGTYAELNNMGMLSIVGSLVPFCEYNQSPRNIYSCQMGKQAIGLPCHAFRFRGDTKLLQLWYPQTPLIKTPMYDFCNIDDYPIGTNAIVAVISYSGYDMEDAVCLNKSSVQRGFKRNCFFKNEYIDLKDVTKGFVSNKNICFGCPEKLKLKLDTDGLPYIGSTLQYGDPLFSYILDGKYHVGHFKYDEVFYVHDVRILGDIEGGNKLTRACITLRSMRVPEVGDKFASRHGQKGICGMLWKAEDLPFTSEGVVADILFNPHGFPTRMTIGMMIELMAGKSASLKSGMEVHEPFEFTEKKSPVKFFCKKLKSVGYNYYGLETMYSGTSGLEIEAHVFCGVVYYERLQQTVIDKYQVRSTGRKDRVTRQPIKTPGSAAIRFGEMERDSLISHGASYNLHDRFMLCSDSCNVNLCTNCGGLVYPVIGRFSGIKKYGEKVLNAERCKSCGDQSLLVRTRIPYILVYLAAELSSVNIKIQFK